MDKLFILTILYDMALAVGSHNKSDELIEAVLQKLMLHSGFPIGLFLSKKSKSKNSYSLKYGIGDNRFKKTLGKTVDLEQFEGAKNELEFAENLFEKLKISPVNIRKTILLNASEEGMFLLCASEEIEISYSPKVIFEPVMNNFAKNLKLLRKNESVFKRTKENLYLAEQVIHSTTEGIMIADQNLKILYANPSLAEISGYSENEIIGKTPAFFQSGWHDKEFYRNMWKDIEKNGSWSGEIWDRKKDGSLYYAHLSISAIKDKNNETSHFVGITIDQTERKEREKLIENLHFFDPLTKLPNRTLFEDRLEQKLHEAEKHSEKAALLYFDLDNFKFLNDTIGHRKGDDFLKIAASKIYEELTKKSEDILFSRFGGDEFCVLLEQLESPNEAALVSKKINEIFLKSFKIDEHEFYSGASIGIAVYPEDGGDAQSLLKAADMAMFHAKNNNKNSYQFFTRQMNKRAFEWMLYEFHLRNAVDNNELEVFFQPKVDTLTQEVVGMEALLRWRHPEFGMVSPGTFIPIAEDAGLINKLGLWVLEESCRQTRLLHEKGYDKLKVSVNVSGFQLQAGNFIDLVETTLKKAGLSNEFLELEVTETTLMKNMKSAVEKLNQIKDLNIRISMDDFGTGYSSISYLRKLPIDRLKIDQSFIRDLDDNRGKSVVSAIISLGKNLGLDIIAEGVESREQLRFLEFNLCDEIQGYYYSPPVSVVDFEVFLQKHRKRELAQPVK
ncbi:MAG: EAL domain-containing protein [Spirochaetia bacterium]|nr:EAL domain-containing protein [Spirochaetia bacterium]